MEFQNALKQVDEAARAKAALTEEGGINIIVTNGDEVPGGWRVTVDGDTPRTCSGKSAALPALTPGVRTVQVEGEINGKPQVAEKAVIVAGGKSPLRISRFTVHGFRGCQIFSVTNTQTGIRHHAG